MLSIGPTPLVERRIEKLVSAGIRRILLAVCDAPGRLRDCVGDERRLGHGQPRSALDPDAMIERLKRLAVTRGIDVIFVQADHGDDPAIAPYTKLVVREDVLHFGILPRQGEA